MENRYLTFSALKYISLGVKLYYIPSRTNCIMMLWTMMRCLLRMLRIACLYTDFLNFLYHGNPRTLGNLGLRMANQLTLTDPLKR